MTVINTADLVPPELDWAVMWCEAQTVRLPYSRIGSLSGIILEREHITTTRDTTSWLACTSHSVDANGNPQPEAAWWAGPTLAIAGLRCYVAGKLGDTVDVPDVI